MFGDIWYNITFISKNMTAIKPNWSSWELKLLSKIFLNYAAQHSTVYVLG